MKFELLAVLLLSASLCFAQMMPDDDDGGSGDGGGDDGDGVKVKTYLGPVVGKRVDTVDDDGEETSHFEFLGIPYAEPPIDDLRFQEPVPKEPWEDPVDAKEYGPQCPQVDFDGITGEEDCLTLNVYSPRIPSQSEGRAFSRSYLLPVMVWVHPGVFNSGNGQMDPTPMLDRGIVVVSMNYRLGALGYLNLNRPDAAGNMGMKDQIMALQWVRNNIALFGGDPEKVTLAGYGEATHLHQLSPMGRGLYHGVIAQSGGALGGFIDILEENVVQHESQRFATNLECDDDSPVECLQSKSVEELVSNPEGNEDDSEVENALNGLGSYYWLPSIDRGSPSAFMPRHPYSVLMTGRQKDVPLVAGIGEKEAESFIDIIADKLDDMNGNWSMYGPSYVLFLPFNHIKEDDDIIANVTRKHYLGDADISLDESDGLNKMFTNIVFRAPLLKAMQMQSSGQKAPIFVYERTYDLSGIDARIGNPVITSNSFFSEDAFLFGSVDQPGVRSGVLSEEDKEVADMMVYMWTNFVKYGVPTPFKDKKLPTWEPYNARTRRYLDISPEPEMKEKMKEAEFHFWQKLYYADKDRYFRGKNLGFAGTSSNSPFPVVSPLAPSQFRPIGLGGGVGAGSGGAGGGSGAPITRGGVFNPLFAPSQPNTLTYPYYF